MAVWFYNFASCGQRASEEGPVLYWIPYWFSLNGRVRYNTIALLVTGTAVPYRTVPARYFNYIRPLLTRTFSDRNSRATYFVAYDTVPYCAVQMDTRIIRSELDRAVGSTVPYGIVPYGTVALLSKESWIFVPYGTVRKYVNKNCTILTSRVHKQVVFLPEDWSPREWSLRQTEDDWSSGRKRRFSHPR